MTSKYSRNSRTWREIDEVFGDGTDYDWALDITPPDQDKEVKLSDLYEPAEIASRMLTDADQVVRLKDVPERFQVRVFS